MFEFQSTQGESIFVPTINFASCRDVKAQQLLAELSASRSENEPLSIAIEKFLTESLCCPIPQKDPAARHLGDCCLS